jgi:hypothetical protein
MLKCRTVNNLQMKRLIHLAVPGIEREGWGLAVRGEALIGPSANTAIENREPFGFPVFVPRTGLEPARPKRAPAPQAGVSTNFTTWAFSVYKAASGRLFSGMAGINQFPFCLPVCRAQNRTRTCTYLRILVPETSASTNSAIWA